MRAPREERVMGWLMLAALVGMALFFLSMPFESFFLLGAGATLAVGGLLAMGFYVVWLVLTER